MGTDCLVGGEGEFCLITKEGRNKHNIAGVTLLRMLRSSKIYMFISLGYVQFHDPSNTCCFYCHSGFLHLHFM